MHSMKSRGGLTEGRGMTDNVRHLWVLSMSYTASIHEAMIELSKTQVQSSEQHVELGTSRRRRDYRDCELFLDWLTTKNPFVVPDVNLFSLSNGLVSILLLLLLLSFLYFTSVKNIHKNHSDCNGTRTHNHLIRKRTLNHLAKPAKCSSPVAVT